MPVDFNKQIIEEFRANGGRVGGPFQDARLILLTTTGKRSGKPHTTPLGYLPDGGERILVIGSAGGAPDHPAWFHNLLADPLVKVEDGGFTYRARAVVLEGAERDDAFARAVEADPGWAGYQAGTHRTLPVVALHPIDAGPPAGPPGDALKAIHDAFRRELAVIRREVAESGPGLGAQLRVNCLTVCRNLHHHHSQEDAGMLLFLDDHRPDLGPVLDRLRHEHRAIAALLGDLQEVISTGAAQEPDRRAVLTEVERLIDELERHLAYEEQLIPILDARTPEPADP